MGSSDGYSQNILRIYQDLYSYMFGNMLELLGRLLVLSAFMKLLYAIFKIQRLVNVVHIHRKDKSL